MKYVLLKALKVSIIYQSFIINMPCNIQILLNLKSVEILNNMVILFLFFIMKTCPCNEYPLKPHFYIVKLGYAGVYLFFLFLLQNIDCGYSLEPPF